jgi:hypothetical protein
MSGETVYRHSSGDDSDGCIACWMDADAEAVWGIPESRTCATPQDDGEGFCAICGHAVEVRE